MNTSPYPEEQLASFKSTLMKGLEDHWILMVPSSLGEVSTVCAFAGAFKKKYGGKVCIVAADNRRSMFYMFSHSIDAMKFAPKNAMRALSNSRLLDRTRFEIGYPQNMWANQNGDGRSFGLHQLYINQPGRGGLSFPDLIRYIMNLDWDAPMSLGVIRPEIHNPAMDLAAKHGVEQGNSVILFPGNNSNKPAGARFWNALSRAYVAAGKKVFYCLTGSYARPANLDIPGEELDLTPGVAVALCEIAGHMVSGSNGLLHLSLLTQATFEIDAILTDGVDGVGKFAFTEIDPYLTSTLRASPELVRNLTRRYAEWVYQEQISIEPLIADMVAAAAQGRAQN